MNRHNVVSLELWFAPRSPSSSGQGVYVNVPKEGQIVQVKFSYYLRNIMMECNDFSQLFVKFIGEGTAVKTDKLVVMIAFPSVFGEPSSVYVHPLGLKKEVTKDCKMTGMCSTTYLSRYLLTLTWKVVLSFQDCLAQAQITRTVFFLWQTWRKLKESTQVFTKGPKMLGLFYPILLFCNLLRYL